MRIIFLLIWSVFCISLSLIVLLFTFNKKLPLQMARTMWAPGILFFTSTKLKINGLEHIKTNKTYIITANHTSYLDIPVLFKILPLNIHFIAKKELRKVPFLGWYMRATDMIFINRGNSTEAKQSLIDAATLIRNGKTVLIFPEGTVSEDGEVKRFKKGGFNIALEAGVDILPIAVKGTGKIWPSDSNFKIKGGTVTVNIGKPIEINAFEKTDLTKLTNYTCEKVKDLHKIY